MKTLNFEFQLETDLLKLFDFAVPNQYTWSMCPEKMKYPAIVARCDRWEVEASFKERGIFSADLLLHVQTYRADDKQGIELQRLLNQARGVLLAPRLAERLNAVSGCTIFAAMNLEGYENPDTEIRSYTLQLQVKFSPAKITGF